MNVHPILALLLAAAPQDGEAADFSANALMPKQETRADVFLKEHPEYDGRGVTVAIFDTGVDPGAAGLQTTPDGRPKLVDIVDASGSGDVDTSTLREAEDGKIKGISGRELTPDPAWTNPTGDWRVGQKRAWEVFPRGLINRMTADRARSFDETQRDAVHAASRAVEAFDEANPSPTKKQLEARQELQARVDQLKALDKDLSDPGPVFDCIVFHDGERWRAAIDTDEDGEFADETALTNFRDERKFATFGERDLMNYVLNIYEDGDRLSIVTDTGSHGTHVAGIVAAHYPDRPELNGIAPGAQLVSVKIGDTRLGSSSIGTGDVRGFIATLQNECQIVNMSYGGPTALPNEGRVEDLRSELVNEHGVIFVSTAGNNGPALTSLGGPGGTTTATLGVGATVSPDMMAQQYAVRDPYDELNYNWSSRGPATDGYLGVDFCAPGGAIAPVTNWSLRANALMNGTSMAAPSVCGGIALLISGLEAEGVPYSPHSVRRALANTARSLDGADPWAQGAGVVRIDAAWRHLKKYSGRDDRDIRYDIRIAGRDDARGIYLREPFENDRLFEETVTISPALPRDADNRRKVDFNRRVLLEATAPWVEVAGQTLMMWGGRGVGVRVDPRELPAGAHFAEIIGRDAAAPSLGPLFRIPVTVIRTQEVTAKDDWTHRETLELRPGNPVRRFLEVPEGATWADIRIHRLDSGTDRTLVLHTVQLQDQESFADHGVRSYIGFTEGEEEIRSREVLGGRTLEVALVQNWSSLGACRVELEVSFQGIVPVPAELTLDTASGAVPLSVRTPLRLTPVAPSGTLEWLRRTLVPESVEIRPLDEMRDGLWDGKLVHELVREYKIEVEQAGEYTPSPAVNYLPYVEDTFESSLWRLEDMHGRVVTFGAGAEYDEIELAKGSYRLFVHNRHDDRAALEELGKTAVYLDRKLAKPLSVGFRHDSAGEDRVTPTLMLPGEDRILWVTPPAKRPDGAEAGDRLLGTFTLGRKEEGRLGAGSRPGGWPLEVLLTPESDAKEKEPEASDADDDPRGPRERVAEAVRDLEVKKLAGLKEDDDFNGLAREILSDFPNHLPVLVAQLERTDREDGAGDTRAIVRAADRVIRSIDRGELAEHFGKDVDPEDSAAQRERKEREAERDALRTALYHKARALAHAAAEARAASAVGDAGADGAEAGNPAAEEAAAEAYREFAAWADADGKDYLDLRVLRERGRGHDARALAELNAGLADAEEPDRELYEQRIALLEALGWSHWAERARRDVAERFPEAPRVF